MPSLFGRVDSVEKMKRFLKQAVEEGWYALYPAVDGVEPPYHDLEFDGEDILVWLKPEKPIRFPKHLLNKAASFIWYLLTEGKWYYQGLLDKEMFSFLLPEDKEEKLPQKSIEEIIKEKFNNANEV